MLKAVKVDIEDVCDALEHLNASLGRLTKDEKVDVAARLRAASKTIKIIDDGIKDEIKKWCKEKPGTVKGEVFKAVLSYNEVNRFNQKRYKEENPEAYETYIEANDEARITFEPR